MKVDKVLKTNLNTTKEIANKKYYSKTAEKILSNPKLVLYHYLSSEIDQIANRVEQESGWKFIDYSFVLLSDFQVNPKTQELEAKSNEVTSCRELSSNSERETRFMFRYHKELKEIQALYLRLMPLEVEVVCETHFKNIKPEEDEEEKEEKKDIKSHEINEFGEEGETLLVKWLNRLADSDNVEEDIQEFLSLDISLDLKEYLAYWILICSSCGINFYCQYMMYEEENKAKIIEFPKKDHKGE